MKLNDLINNSLKDILAETDVVSVKPLSNDEGTIVKIIIEYVPRQSTRGE